MCGSAQKSIMIGYDGLLAGSINLAIAGGMESMTNAPHVLTSARTGYRLGNGVLHDHMFLDGLEDAYEPVSYTHLDVYKRQSSLTVTM